MQASDTENHGNFLQLFTVKVDLEPLDNMDSDGKDSIFSRPAGV
jgi:hypothetical protein